MFFLTRVYFFGAMTVPATPIKRVVLIPYWVQEALSRHKDGLHEALCFDTLHKFINTNDLIGFLALQDYVLELAGHEVHGDALTLKWTETAREEASKTLLTQTIIPLVKSPEYLDDVFWRLFSRESCFERLPHHTEAFNVYDITHDVASIVIHPGFFTEEAGSNGYRTALIVALLKVLYAYNAYHEVAHTPLFKRYLDLLAQKELTV
jgi:hypothetical protein